MVSNTLGLKLEELLGALKRLRKNFGKDRIIKRFGVTCRRIGRFKSSS